MKFAKRAVAALIAALLALTMVGCHEAKEVVASYDDIEITGGMYLAMLLEADGAARNLADEQNESDSAITDYGNVQIKNDGKVIDYYDYVKDEAKKLIRQYIATETLAKEYKVTLSDEDKTGLDAYVSYLWDTYGYGAMYEENGVGRASYTEYMGNAGYLRGNLFEAIYGKEGKTPITEEELKKYMNDNYCIANVITENLSQTDENGNTFNLTEDEAKDLLEKLNTYADRLTKGDADFETIYHEHTESEHEHEDEDTADKTADNTDADQTTDKSLIDIDPFGIAPFALAAIVGLLVGSIKIGSFSLTTTGGYLLASLVFGHFAKMGKINLMPPAATLKVFREFGLMLFLIGAGIAGGAKFVECFQPIYFLYGAMMTIIPMVIGFLFAKYVLKLSLLNNLGSITGGMTSTPALGTLISVAGTEDVAAAYAATYPIALISVVLASQFIIMLF